METIPSNLIWYTLNTSFGESRVLARAPWNAGPTPRRETSLAAQERVASPNSPSREIGEGVERCQYPRTDANRFTIWGGHQNGPTKKDGFKEAARKTHEKGSAGLRSICVLRTQDRRTPNIVLSFAVSCNQGKKGMLTKHRLICNKGIATHLHLGCVHLSRITPQCLMKQVESPHLQNVSQMFGLLRSCCFF